MRQKLPRFWNRCFELCKESGEDQERRLLVIPVLLAFDEITHFGGGRLPNKGRYGCVASAKPSPGTIPQKTLFLGKKVPENLMTGQVFMTFRVPDLKIFSK